MTSLVMFEQKQLKELWLLEGGLNVDLGTHSSFLMMIVWYINT